jgi:hypothetical protein
MDDNSLGLYDIKNKKFYYLEAGSITVWNTIERLQRVLIARGILKYPTDAPAKEQMFKTLTVKDAKIEEYEMVPIYLSNHIRNVVTATDDPEKKKTGQWS